MKSWILQAVCQAHKSSCSPGSCVSSSALISSPLLLERLQADANLFAGLLAACWEGDIWSCFNNNTLLEKGLCVYVHACVCLLVGVHVHLLWLDQKDYLITVMYSSAWCGRERSLRGNIWRADGFFSTSVGWFLEARLKCSWKPSVEFRRSGGLESSQLIRRPILCGSMCQIRPQENIIITVPTFCLFKV